MRFESTSAAIVRENGCASFERVVYLWGILKRT